MALVPPLSTASSRFLCSIPVDIPSPIGSHSHSCFRHWLVVNIGGDEEERLAWGSACAVRLELRTKWCLQVLHCDGRRLHPSWQMYVCVCGRDRGCRCRKASESRRVSREWLTSNSDHHSKAFISARLTPTSAHNVFASDTAERIRGRCPTQGSKSH